jgi:hypothetical protein
VVSSTQSKWGYSWRDLASGRAGVLGVLIHDGSIISGHKFSNLDSFFIEQHSEAINHAVLKS